MAIFRENAVFAALYSQTDLLQLQLAQILLPNSAIDIPRAYINLTLPLHQLLQNYAINIQNSSPYLQYCHVVANTPTGNVRRLRLNIRKSIRRQPKWVEMVYLVNW